MAETRRRVQRYLTRAASPVRESLRCVINSFLAYAAILGFNSFPRGPNILLYVPIIKYSLYLTIDILFAENCFAFSLY